MKRAVDNICPTCGGDVPNTEHKGEYPGALSRVDNETEICSNCGLKEALGGMMRGVTSTRLPIETIVDDVMNALLDYYGDIRLEYFNDTTISLAFSDGQTFLIGVERE